MITATVYLIRHDACPAEGYIGKTINREIRWKHHHARSPVGTTPLYRWWRRWSDETGRAPTFHIVAEQDFATRREADAWAYEREVAYISWAKAQGVYVLYNANDGGHGGRNPLPETRAKMSAALAARNRSRPVSATTREKIRAANLGTKHGPHSAETRAKISAARRGQKLSKEACSKISARQKGQKRAPRSATTREKIGASNRRRGVGVVRCGGRWKARIGWNGVDLYLGVFESEAEARAARTAAELKYWGPPED